MTTLQKISGEIVPLSRRDGIVLGVIIACVFQFALFFSPALAADAVNQSQMNGIPATSQINDDMVANSPLIKSDSPTTDSSLLMNPPVANTTPATTSLATSSVQSFENLLPPAVQNNGQSDADSPELVEPAPTITIVRTSTNVITAYNSEVGQTDGSPCVTANGYNVCESGVEDTIAANFLKFGTKVQIPELFGDRVFVVRDRMNKKHPNRVDVWMKDHDDAIHFGVKTAKIQVVEITN